MVDLIAIVASNWRLPIQNVKLVSWELRDKTTHVTFKIKDGLFTHFDSVCLSDHTFRGNMSTH